MNHHQLYDPLLPPLPLSMRPVQLLFDYAPYDCRVEIEDMLGRRDYTFPLATITEEDHPRMLLDVYGDDFTLTLTPMASDFKPLKEDIKATLKDGWKEKLLGGIATVALSALSQMILRLACTYRITLPPSEMGQNGIVPVTLKAEIQGYVKSGVFSVELLELEPVMYGYFEVKLNGTVPPFQKARGVNHREVMRIARIAGILHGLGSIIMYPIEVGRFKRLTKDKKVNRTMRKFYRLSPEKREKIRKKWTDGILL